jgi:hypothetical protein
MRWPRNTWFQREVKWIAGRSIHDWYCRMVLEAGLTDLWLAKGDLTQARPEAERFLELTLATAERTWQAVRRQNLVRQASS